MKLGKQDRYTQKTKLYYFLISYTKIKDLNVRFETV